MDIKLCTDHKQSEKLKKILPSITSDMSYDWVVIGKEYSSIPQCRKFIDDELPCWSLAALLDVIPQEIFDGEYIINITEGLDNRWILTYDHHENRHHSYYGLSSGADNLVDACYEMILKLHELKML